MMVLLLILVTEAGVIRLIGEKLGKPLQWVVCLFHFNEFSLRNLVKQHNRKTNGPYGFKETIGKKLERCESLSIIKFKPIEKNLPTIIYIVKFSDLITDQKYVLKIVQIVSLGEIYVSLSLRNLGKLLHVNYLTMANRNLRLHVETKKPSENL